MHADLARVPAEHGAALRRLAGVYTRTTADADDLVQEIAIALWKALPTFRGECSERTFVFRVARNRALTQLHRRHLPVVPLETASEVPDPAPLSDDVMEQRARREALHRAVRQLPESLRAAVMLRLEGLSDEESAGVLGISPNNVAVRLSRARDALRARMGPDEGEGR